MEEPVKFYTDENVSSAIVNGLRRRGIDVLSAKDAKMLGKSDEEHLRSATENNRILFTQEGDFLKLHASDYEHIGIVHTHQRTPIGKIIRGLEIIHLIMMNTDMKNHVELV